MQNNLGDQAAAATEQSHKLTVEASRRRLAGKQLEEYNALAALDENYFIERAGGSQPARAPGGRNLGLFSGVCACACERLGPYPCTGAPCCR